MRFLIFILMLASFPVWTQASEVPPLLYSAFTQSTLIVRGQITSINPRKTGDPQASDSVTLRVTETLLGKSPQADLRLSYYPSLPSVKRPPRVWDRVVPVVGKNILAFLRIDGESLRPMEVLDIDGTDRDVLPMIQKMLEVQQWAEKKEFDRLFSIVDDPSPLIRNLAVDQLVGTASGDSKIQQRLFTLLKTTILNSHATVDQRTEAIMMSGTRLFGSGSTELNNEILAVLLEACGDPEIEVRGEAIQLLYGYSLGSSNAARYAILSIPLPKLRVVVDRLSQDVSKSAYFSAQAKELLNVLKQRL